MSEDKLRHYLKQATAELRVTRDRLREMEDAAHEPIAIVGMACRFPGQVRSPGQLWELVVSGRDVTSVFPSDRGWVGADRIGTARGGFLSGIDQFDADFFGVSPREAAAMDPQQRLLLETAWEAFEYAGIDPRSLRNSDTGVFVGTSGQDYLSLLNPRDGAEGYLMTGGAASVASGRISYFFGFHGPTVTIDTACSSSLVALHWAAQSLRAGESALAVAGGATVMSTTGILTEFGRQSGLASDGRCKPFAAAADGTGLGEGAGMIVVERLSDARRLGHPILAVIRGSAVNSDGASNGLTAPNGQAQRRVIRRALADVGLSTSDVDVVEAHGTGTRLGDPIEAEALLATYGRDRPADRPLLLGAVKSNIGHAQAAAGVAGVMKMVLAMRHGLAPKTLHVDEPTPHVDWASGQVRLLTENTGWPELERPRRAGVSAFGISGANAHVILEEFPDEPGEPVGRPADVPRVGLWLLSAHSDSALRAQARRLGQFVRDDPALDPSDVGFSLATTRCVFGKRAAVVAHDREAFLHGLDALADGGADSGLVCGAAVEHRLAILFSGQGSQRLGMGRELYAAFPAFAEAFDEVSAHVAGRLGRTLRDLLFTGEESLLEQTLFAQPALFAIEVALFRLLSGWGLHPDFLLGHSVGEIAAAHVSGVLSLTDASALVTARGRLMQHLAPEGTMAAVQATEQEVTGLLDGRAQRVGVAAVNGPMSVTISGDENEVAEIVRRLQDQGRKIKYLRVNRAFHSPHMDGMLSGFREELTRLSFHRPRIPIASTLTGELVTEDQMSSPEYWLRHARQPVRFLDGLRCLRFSGATAFLELGPEAVLTPMAEDCLADAEAVFSSALRAKEPETRALMRAMAGLHVRGVAVDWRAVFAGHGGRRVELPTYAFQRQRHWLPVATHASPERSLVDDWRYRVVWKPLEEELQPGLSGTWLAVLPSERDLHERVRAWLAALTGHGARVVPVESTAKEDRTELAERLKNIAAGEPGLRGVLSFVALAQQPDPEHPGVPAGTLSTLAVVQALGDADLDVPLWCVTRGAISTGDEDEVRDPTQAQVWGLGRVVAQEHPQRWGGLVDMPDVVDESAVRLMCATLACRSGENQFAVRSSGIHVARLMRAPASPEERAWRSHGTVLVTGGTGALGGHVARWLACSGAEHVVLVSRRGPAADGATELEADLIRLGVTVTVAAGDVADRQSLTKVFASIPDDRPLTAVVHTAGVLDDGIIDELTPERLENVLRAKAIAAWNLHELTRELDLTAFVLFSSAAGVLGSPGQGNYAAANAYLDALAEYRRANGLPATSVAWGGWGGMGMASGRTRPSHHGVVKMAPDLALSALHGILDRGETTMMVADVKWDQLLETATSVRRVPILADLPEARRIGDISAPEEAVASATARRLAKASERERRQVMLDVVRAEAASVLGHSSVATIAPDRPFNELGFDSLTAVELRNRLGAFTGVRLPATLVLDHPTPVALTDHLLDEYTAPMRIRQNGDDEPRGALCSLYQRLGDLDRFDDAANLLETASRARNTFSAEDAGSGYPKPHRLTQGPVRSVLFCCPSLVVPTGSYQYALFADFFAGRRPVWALPTPGYVAGEALPDSLDALVRRQAQQVRTAAGDGPFVIVGYSSGGWLAQALAGRLEADGKAADALVLLDPPVCTDTALRRDIPVVAHGLLGEYPEMPVGDDELVAMGAYLRLFSGWVPEPVEAPTLVIRPAEVVATSLEWEKSGQGDGVSYRADEVLTVDGDHFTMLGKYADMVANAVDKWIAAKL